MTAGADIDLKSYIRDVPDFPKPGILFKDITTLLKEAEPFRRTVELLAERYAGRGIQKVVGIESRGFIFAAALALQIGAGMVPVRKVGKLPARCLRQTYDLEYGTDSVEVHEDAVSAGERVLIVDDVIATGGTLAAACLLMQTVKAEIVEAVTVIELTFLPGRQKLGNVPFHSLLQF